MVVKGCHQEDTTAFTVFFLRVFEVGYLYYNRQRLSKIDAAQNRDEQLLADDDAGDSHNAAEGQTAGVAHEYLRRIAVPPIETNAGTDDGGDEYHQFTDVGYVHDIQIGGEDDVARHVPVANPSKPSVRFAPFETPAIMKTMMGIKMRNDHLPVSSPNQRVNAA